MSVAQFILGYLAFAIVIWRLIIALDNYTRRSVAKQNRRETELAAQKLREEQNRNEKRLAAQQLREEQEKHKKELAAQQLRKKQKKRERELAAQKLREEQALNLNAQQESESREKERLEQLLQSNYFDNEVIEKFDAYENIEDEADITESNIKIEDLNNPFKKSNWRDFEKILSDNQVFTFYHFTDRANLPSIKEHGICSWDFCENNDIKITFANSSEQSRSLDKRDKLQNYVRVSFVKEHPMRFRAVTEGRIKDPVILEISTEVALWKYTKYADRNAVKNGARVGDSLEDFKRIRFDLVKKAKHFDIENEEERQFYQAELLILDKIPIKYISNLNRF